MGRWLEWCVTDDLTESERRELGARVDGPLRSTLPLVAEQIVSERPRFPSFGGRLALWLNDREMVKYARRADVVTVEQDKIGVALQWGSHETLVFRPCKSDIEAGRTLGFQDYVSLGVLAAASEVSDKVVLVGGDDFDAEYVSSILSRFGKGGLALRPGPDFMSRLPNLRGRTHEGDQPGH